MEKGKEEKNGRKGQQTRPNMKILLLMGTLVMCVASLSVNKAIQADPLAVEVLEPRVVDNGEEEPHPDKASLTFVNGREGVMPCASFDW